MTPKELIEWNRRRAGYAPSDVAESNTEGETVDHDITSNEYGRREVETR